MFDINNKTININGKTYKYKDFEINDDSTLYKKYAIIENFEIIKNPNDEFVEINFPVYNLETTPHLYHLLQNNISNYEILKKYINNLQPIIIKRFPKLFNEISNDLEQKYKNNQNNFLYENKNLKIKKFIFLPFDSFGVGNEFASIDIDLFHYVYEKSIRNKKYLNADETSLLYSERKKILNHSFKNFCINDQSLPKKIFISRLLITSKRNNQKNSGINLMPENRHVDFDLQLKIESFFSELGYVILNLENMSLSNQIKYFYNANIIAGISGCNLYNSIFTKKNVKVLDLSLPTKLPYDFDWKYVIDKSNDFYYKIPYDEYFYDKIKEINENV